MRAIFKKIAAVFITTLACFSLFFGYRYVTKNLTSFISTFLNKNLDTKILIKKAGIGFPLCLELKGVEIGEAINIKSVQVYPDPRGFLLKNRAIVSTVKIVNPVLEIKKERKPRSCIPDFLNRREKKYASGISEPKFYFSKIRIQNGSLIYETGEDIIEFVDIKGNIENPGIFFSREGPCQFAATGFLKNKDSGFLSPLRMDGFVEAGSAIKARVELSGIGLDRLGPLHGKYLSQLIEEASFDFKSDIQISKKNLLARCFLEGEDIVLKKGEGQRLDTAIEASFILLVNFRNNLVKVKNLQGNLLKVIFGR